jgi:hypothetical protein
MLVQTTQIQNKKRTSVPIQHCPPLSHLPPINADRIRLACRRHRRSRVLPKPGDVAHLQRDRRDTTRAQPRGATHDKRRSPPHDCRVAQGDLSRCVAEIILYDLLDRLQAPQGGRRKLLRVLHERSGSGSVIRIAAVFTAPRTLYLAEHFRIEPIVLVQAFCRFAVEEDGLWCGVDEREEEVARDLAEVHPRDELLVGLESWVYRLAVDLVVERRAGQHGAPVIERAPLGVNHHHAARRGRGVVAEFGDVGDLLEVRAVRACPEYRAEDTSTSGVRSRKRSAYRLRSRYAPLVSFYLKAEESQVGIRRSREQHT